MSSLPVAVLPTGNVQLANGNVLDGKLIDASSKASNQMAAPVQQGNGKVLLSNGNSVVVGANNTAPALPQTITVNKSSVVMSNGATVHANNLAQLPPITSTATVNRAALTTSNAASNLSANPMASPIDVSTANQVAAISSNHAANVARANGNYAAAGKHAETAMRHLRVAEAMLHGNSAPMQMENFSTSKMFHNVQFPRRREHFDTTATAGANIVPPKPTTQYYKPSPFGSVGGAQYFYVGEAYGVPTST